jgi:ABC-type transporter Mla subunit MlaD
MQSGNGIDIGAVYALLQEVAQRVAAHDRRFDQIDAGLTQIVGVVNEHTRKIDDLAAGLTELRRSVNEYHGAVIGHGIELTRLAERVTRIEVHLNLDPAV